MAAWVEIVSHDSNPCFAVLEFFERHLLGLRFGYLDSDFRCGATISFFVKDGRRYKQWRKSQQKMVISNYQAPKFFAVHPGKTI
jgi:hypothetical protein